MLGNAPNEEEREIDPRLKTNELIKISICVPPVFTRVIIVGTVIPK